MAFCDSVPETDSAEYRSFKRHFADLFNGIQNPVPLSARLYAVDLLSRDTRKKIYELQLTEQKMSELLDAIETAIRQEPQKFHKFVEEMEEDSSMQHLCDKLRSTCAQLKSPLALSSPLPNTSEQKTTDHSTLPSSTTSVNTSTIQADVPQLKILLCGRTGIGKSSLCNSLLGRVVGDPGQSADGTRLDACTTKLDKITVRLSGIVINIFDSPGLQDGDVENEKEYVEDMYRKCKDVDLVLYCMEMTASRLTPAETTAISLITKKFGPIIWERCVCVLTKANRVLIPGNKRQKKIEYHETLFKSFRVKMCSLLKKAGVPEGICDGLHMVAAGYFDGMNDTESERKILFASERCKADPGPPIVLVDFISELWVTCLEAVPEASRIRFLQATALGGRIINPTEDMRKMLEKATKDLAGKIHDSADEYVHVHHDDLNPIDLTPNQQWFFKDTMLGKVLVGVTALMKAK